MYGLVPVRSKSSSPGLSLSESPKSAMRKWPSEPMSTFGGFMSRCMTDCECMYSKPETSSAAMKLIICSVGGPLTKLA
eukprot:scaffold120555_cov28-Tisochrysis_lutea.AAC.4